MSSKFSKQSKASSTVKQPRTKPKVVIDPTPTIHISDTFDTTRCWDVFIKLVDNIEWHDSIKTGRGSGYSTRKAFHYKIGMIPEVDDLISESLEVFGYSNRSVYGVYLNYYRDGNDHTPTHVHKDTNQIVISLGAKRILMVGKASYHLDHGDIIAFGSSQHGVPKILAPVGERISIAVFCSKAWL